MLQHVRHMRPYCLEVFRPQFLPLRHLLRRERLPGFRLAGKLVDTVNFRLLHYPFTTLI